jgi:hypothetical protein
VTQGSLLDFVAAGPRQAPRPLSEQGANLHRVSKAIAPHVLEFCRERLSSAPNFHAYELNSFVNERCYGAPGSADRILRQLRHKGFVRYEVVDRAKSHYRVTWVAT